VFEKKGDGWEEQLLSNSFKLKSGDNLTAKKMVDGEFPVFGGNGIAGYHNEFNLLDSNVIVGRVGALCGNVRHINENIWLTDNAFKIVDFKYEFDHSFLTYLLNYKNLRSYARQAAQPVISNSSLQDVVLNFPTSKEEQQAIVLQLDSLRAETQKLEAVYQKKIDDLEELKKSILQKAFAGDLPSRQAGLETEKVVVV
jgi:type I restriction enzyme S subunit